MKTNRTCILLLLGLLSAGPAVAQEEPARQQELERLRRDQDEILRKAQRLRDLMTRLQQRYERENKAEQVALLKQGLQHLERAGLLQDVASIRDDLQAAALSEALRKQEEVVADLERLLDILLQRRSIENLQQEIQEATEMAATARELERRQADLQRRTEAALEQPANAAEQQLQQQLEQLRRDQAAEAQANARAAGMRRPFLEDALQRVQQLLDQQQALEQRVERERQGQTGADREQQFALGELLQRARELSESVRDQGRQSRLQQDAQALREALANQDQNAAQQARDRLEADLTELPRRRDPGQPDGAGADPQWEQLRAALERAPAGATAAERQELAKLAEQAAELGKSRQATAGEQNGAQAEQLGQDVGRAAEQFEQAHPQQPGQPPAAETPAAALRQAQQALQEAAQQARTGADRKAQEQVQQAVRALTEARARLDEQNPAATRQAGEMAAEADAVERQLRNAPAAEQAEQQAADELARAEQSLRETAAGLEPQEQGQPRDVQRPLQQSRQGLEQARATLEQALQGSASERQDEMARAAERQQQLRQSAQGVQQQLQQGQQRGDLGEQQAKAASEQMQKATEAMQAAEQQLRTGQQSSASQQQQRAAQALQDAQQALQQHRPPGPEQQQAMQQLADEQQKLEEEILRLAQEARERKNPEARRALENAAEAAKRAQRAMREGDQQETQEQQEEARQQLEEAAKQLEEERDRYLDLRQEELLFRMKDELLALLERQRPITAETLQLQATAAGEGLSRPGRRRLNQFAEEEQELAGKVLALVQALQEEGNLVYRTVLQANQEDLVEVARRLAGRQPDPGSYTTMLQQDVERRTLDLLGALEREQKRREEERQRRQQEQQQQQQQGQNRFSPQREKLVSLIAELEMLKQLELDTRRATDNLRTLVELRGGDTINDAESALVERLGHRHAEVTRLFAQIKAGVEEALKSMQNQDGQQPNPEDQGRGRGR